MGLVAIAGCSAANDQGSAVSLDGADSSIFQQGKTAVSGSHLGLIGTRTVAFTFDDGPLRPLTTDLLNFLKQEDVKATFFMVGKMIPGNQDLLERMRDEGMSLGNHSYHHEPIVRMSKTNMNGVYREIADTDSLISPYLNAGKHIFFRSPGGSWTAQIATAMNQRPDIAAKYIGPVFWDIGGTTWFADDNGKRLGGEPERYDQATGIVTLVQRNAKGKVIKRWTAKSRHLYAAADWDCSTSNLSMTPEMCAEGYINEIERSQGGVVLMHDVHAKSIEMFKLMLPVLKAKGYKFITLDEVPGIQRFE